MKCIPVTAPRLPLPLGKSKVGGKSKPPQIMLSGVGKIFANLSSRLTSLLFSSPHSIETRPGPAKGTWCGAELLPRWQKASRAQSGAAWRGADMAMLGGAVVGRIPGAPSFDQQVMSAGVASLLPSQQVQKTRPSCAADADTSCRLRVGFICFYYFL